MVRLPRPSGIAARWQKRLLRHQLLCRRSRRTAFHGERGHDPSQHRDVLRVCHGSLLQPGPGPAAGLSKAHRGPVPRCSGQGSEPNGPGLQLGFPGFQSTRVFPGAPFGKVGCLRAQLSIYGGRWLGKLWPRRSGMTRCDHECRLLTAWLRTSRPSRNSACFSFSWSTPKAKLWRVTATPSGGTFITTKRAALPASFLAAPIRRSNWSRVGGFRRIARSFRKNRTSLLRRIARSFARRPSALASTYSSPSSVNNFTSTESRTFFHGNSGHFFSYCWIMLRGVSGPERTCVQPPDSSRQRLFEDPQPLVIACERASRTRALRYHGAAG